MNREKQIVMLGASFDPRDTIASVVNSHSQGGLFERFPITCLATHGSGSALHTFRRFLCAWLAFVAMLARGQVMLVHVHGAGVWRRVCFLLPAFLFGVPAILHAPPQPARAWLAPTCPARASRCRK